MARQIEDSLPLLERTDELPALSADALRRLDQGGVMHRPDTADALDRSLETLREKLEGAERRWRQLESRIEEQDSAIRELQNELNLANSRRTVRNDSLVAGVPELTEIVVPGAAASVAADASTADAGSPAAEDRTALLERIAALEGFIAGQNDRLQAAEAELSARSERIAELESRGGADR